MRLRKSILPHITEHVSPHCSGRLHGGALAHPTQPGLLFYAVGSSVLAMFESDPCKQVQLRGHDDEITALALSPHGRLLASGQRGTNSDVIIWDTANLTQSYRHAGSLSSSCRPKSTVADAMRSQLYRLFDLARLLCAPACTITSNQQQPLSDCIHSCTENNPNAAIYFVGLAVCIFLADSRSTTWRCVHLDFPQTSASSQVLAVSGASRACAHQLITCAVYHGRHASAASTATICSAHCYMAGCCLYSERHVFVLDTSNGKIVAHALLPEPTVCPYAELQGSGWDAVQA
jgi:WD40 repeat protein